MTAHQQHASPATEWRTLDTADGPMRVYVARPPAPDGAVIVLQEAFGVNEHIQDVARRVADAGYLALAPDLFHRHEVGLVDYADRDTAMSRISALGVDEIGTDVGAALRHLAETEAISHDHTGLLGFCFGGRAAFTAASLVPDLAATVVFYGPGVAAGPHAVLDRVDGIGGHVLMLVGDQDPTIPAEHLDAIQNACEQTQVDLRIELFPGAGHAFHCDARPQAYHEEAAKRAWQQTVQFLAATVPANRP